MEKTISFLLKEACIPIKYRLKKEILGERDENLQEEIEKDPRVKFFLSLQGKKGWIPRDFHSPEGVETACRVFAEKGLDLNFQPYSRMVKELEKRESSFDNGSLQRVGKVLDERGFGGSKMIKAALLARAGLEKRVIVREQVEKALACFDFVREVNSIEEVTKIYRGKKVFAEGAIWPGIYHLRLLAFSQHWRTEKNLDILHSGLQKLIELSPIPPVNVKEKSQIIAPCAFLLNNFNPILEKISPQEWMAWFHQMELLARVKMVVRIKELNHQLKILRAFLLEGNGLFTKTMHHRAFFSWSPYAGLALEKDWRSPRRRISDLSFRSILIDYYSEKN